jgi:hypothetical protein
MNSHTQIQNTLNHPPLQPYSPNLNPTTQNSSELEVNVIHRVTRRINSQKNQSTHKNVLPTPNR